MIEYSMQGISAEELSFRANPGAGREGRFSLTPAFSRSVRGAKEDAEVFLFTLECKIENKPEAPTPFDVTARFVAVFRVKNMVTDEDKRIFVVNATETVFPYVRAAISNLTCDALVAPLVLPATSGAMLFPDDRGPLQFAVSVDPKIIT